VPESAYENRAVWLEEVLGTTEEFYLFRMEGQVEDRLTLTRKSIGAATDEQGLFRALREILGDPPGWVS
jgi:hypothetical protein